MSKFCGNCGNQSPDNANVCGYCGNRFPQPMYQQPIYQQPTYQQNAYQQPPFPQQNVKTPLNAKGFAFPVSKICVLVATIIQIFATFMYYFETFTIKAYGEKESIALAEYIEDEDATFLLVIFIFLGIIALVLDLLSLIFTKFGRAIKQIPQMIIAFLNFGFYAFIVFVIRDELGSYTRYIKSDGLVLMLILTVLIITLMIVGAVFQSKEKKAEMPVAYRF